MNKKNSLDLTSLIMIVVFSVIVIGGAVFVFFYQFGNKNGETDDMASGAEIEETEEPVMYETYEEISDRFIEICRAGDVEAMYDLYYMDLLTERCNESGVTKEEFDRAVRDNMAHIKDFEEYRYGEGELIMNSPAGYLNELFLRAYGSAFPYSKADVQDFVDLRAYFENGAFIDFMLAQIDGYWYAVV